MSYGRAFPVKEQKLTNSIIDPVKGAAMEYSHIMTDNQHRKGLE